MKTVAAVLLACFAVGCAAIDMTPSPRGQRGTTADIDGQQLASALAPNDSVVVVRIDSQQPAMTEIFRCTVERTVHGPTPPQLITVAFLHFPNCPRLSLGERYLCAIRPESGTEYDLIRSDMLYHDGATNLQNYAWEADSPRAKSIEAEIGRHNPQNRPVAAKPGSG